MQFLIARAGALETLRVAAVGVEGGRFGAFLLGDLLLHLAEAFGGHCCWWERTRWMEDILCA